MFNSTLFFLGAMVFCGHGVYAQLFMQNFRHSNQVSAYLSTQPVPPAPQSGQFTSIASTGPGTVVSIHDGALQIQRNGANVGYFTRNIDFSPDPSTLLFQFSFEVPACSTDSSVNSHSTLLFRIGEGYDNSGGTSNLANTFVNLGIRLTGKPNEFFFRNLASSTDSKVFQDRQIITWVMNRSGSSVQYAAPNGSTENLANNRWDLWVGTEQVFNDATPQNSSFRLSQFKCMYNSLSNIKNFQVRFDNFYINTLNGTLSNSHDFLVGQHYDFESLTNPGGIFQVLNNVSQVPAQGYRFKIASDLWETGANPLRSLPGMAAENPVVFTPNSTSNRHIEGEVHSRPGLVRLEGASFVHFDGRDAAPGQGLLTIRNLEGDRPAIWLDQGANHNTFQACHIVGKPKGPGIIAMGNSGTQPNEGNAFVACQIEGLGHGAYLGLQALAGKNHRVAVRNCKFSNIFNPHGASAYLHVGEGNQHWEIAGNQFLAVGTYSCQGNCHAGFLYLEGWGHIVKDNYFGGLGQPHVTPGRWETIVPTASLSLKAVVVKADHTQVVNNTIGLMSLETDGVPVTGREVFVGYTLEGESVRVAGNTLEKVTIQAHVSDTLQFVGFRLDGTTTEILAKNEVHQVECTVNGVGQAMAYGFLISGQSNTPFEIRGNKVARLGLHTQSAVETMAVGMAFKKMQGTGLVKVGANHVCQLEGEGLAEAFGFLLKANNASIRVENNQVAIGHAVTTDAHIAGIYVGSGGSGVWEVFHNSVVIAGEAASAALNPTYSFYRAGNQPMVLKGNLFHNLRQVGTHYAIGSEGVQALQATRNLLYAPDAQKVGRWGTSSFDFPTWCTQPDRGELYTFADVSASMPHLAEGSLGLQHDGSVALHSWVIDQGPFAHEVAGLQVDFEGNFRRGRNDMGASEVYVAWIGGAPGQETNWHEPSNWSIGEVPDCNQAGMVKIYPVTYLPVVSQPAVFRDLVIAEGAVLSIAATGSLGQCPVTTEPLSLVNRGQLLFTANGSQPVRLTGNLVNDGTIDSEGGVWELAGDATQQIGGLSTTKFYHLKISGNGQKYLHQHVIVGHHLEFVQGLLFTGAYSLTIDDPQATVSATLSSYMVGTLQRVVAEEGYDYFFPVGGEHYRAAATLRFQEMAGISRLAVSFDADYPGEILTQPLYSVSPQATYGYTCSGGKWHILPHGGTAATAVYQLHLEGHGLSCGGTNMTIAKRTGNATASFAGSTNAQQAFTRTGFIGFTEYVALTDFSLLGLQWKTLVASSSFPGVALRWEVEQRVGGGTFSIARSADGKHFQPIGSVAAQQEPGLQAYHFHDLQAPEHPSVLYYRISYQNGGQVWEGKVTAVHVRGNAYQPLRAAPNPATDIVYLEGLFPEKNYVLSLTSLSGEVLWSAKCFGAESVAITALQVLRPGLYLLVLVSPDERRVFKILKE
jgi:hypothetical protein